MDAPRERASAHGEFYRRALQAARDAVRAMRASNDIGDDAFHRIEEDLDWLEMAREWRCPKNEPRPMILAAAAGPKNQKTAQ